MRRAAALLLVLAATGCGEDEPAGSGRLVIDKTRSGGPGFIEGSLTELTLRHEDGGPVVKARQDQPGNGPLLDRTVPAGRYRLTARERPCHGSCGLLDPPASDCRAELEVRRDETTRAVVHEATGVIECVTD